MMSIRIKSGHCYPVNCSSMNSECSPETSTRRDAGEEPPWMDLRRVSGEHSEFMSPGDKQYACHLHSKGYSQK